MEDLHLVNPSQDIKQHWQRDSLRLKVDAHIDGQLSAYEWKEIETEIMSDKVLFAYFQERLDRFKNISELIPNIRIDRKQKQSLVAESSEICHHFMPKDKETLMNKLSKIFSLN